MVDAKQILILYHLGELPQNFLYILVMQLYVIFTYAYRTLPGHHCLTVSIYLVIFDMNQAVVFNLDLCSKFWSIPDLHSDTAANDFVDTSFCLDLGTGSPFIVLYVHDCRSHGNQSQNV